MRWIATNSRIVFKVSYNDMNTDLKSFNGKRMISKHCCKCV